MSDMPVKVLSAADILGADDLHRELVEVPEWGGSVYVRSLTAAERDAITTSVIDDNGNATRLNNMRAKIVALGAIDSEGKRLFTNDDVKALGAKSSIAMDRVFGAIQKASGITKEELKELEGNSDGDPSADLPSD
jgi:hypothetical protein